MDGDTLTPAQLTARLSINERTLRRLSAAYEDVYTALPINPAKPKGRGRVFPPEAVERLEHAVHAMNTTPGMSYVDALTAHRDGRSAPTRTGSAPALSTNTLLPVLAELSALRQEVATLHDLVLSLRAGLTQPPAPSMPPAPVAAPAGDALNDDPDAGPDTTSAPMPPRKLQPNHAALLERMHLSGNRLQLVKGLTLELTPTGQRVSDRPVDKRTIDALQRYRLLVLDGDTYRLTPEVLPYLPADPLL